MTPTTSVRLGDAVVEVGDMVVAVVIDVEGVDLVARYVEIAG